MIVPHRHYLINTGYLKYRIKFKVLSFVYKALNKLAPPYLRDLLTYRTSPHSTRSEGDQELEIPKSGNLGDRAFGVAGPKLWNSLPVPIRKSASFEIFKKDLKTFYFTEAFSDIIENSAS